MDPTTPAKLNATIEALQAALVDANARADASDERWRKTVARHLEERTERIKLGNVVQRYLTAEELQAEFAADPATPPIDLPTLQAEIYAWQTRNFGEGVVMQSFSGVAEEIGELSESIGDVGTLPISLGRLGHALLKSEQGIRGSAAENDAKGRDATGDIMIYLFNLCSRKSWDVETILRETWAHVGARDWTTNPGDADVKARELADARAPISGPHTRDNPR